MSVTWTGKARGPVKVLDTIRLEGTKGAFREQHYIGEPIAIRALYKIIRNHEPYAIITESAEGDTPLARLQVLTQLTEPPEEFIPEEEWTVSTEMIQRDIFSCPLLDEEASTYQLTWPRSEYRSLIETAVNSGEALPDKIKDWPGAQKAVQHLMFRVTGYQEETSIIRRTRRAPVDYAFNRTVYQTKYIYDSEQLEMPAEVQQLFNFGDITTRQVPANCYWGWRIRTQDLTIWRTQAEEVVEFVLAAWSMLCYEGAPGSYFGGN